MLASASIRSPSSLHVVRLFAALGTSSPSLCFLIHTCLEGPSFWLASIRVTVCRCSYAVVATELFSQDVRSVSMCLYRVWVCMCIHTERDAQARQGGQIPDRKGGVYIGLKLYTYVQCIFICHFLPVASPAAACVSYDSRTQTKFCRWRSDPS